ncbi:MAG: MBL fold metallo-hydrolase [Anaerolineales bacterium]|nr:MAG: MBL fold metallo-hydrolase [Anaerolineales bacterium]
MTYQLHKIEVGPWPMNAYLVVCAATHKSVIVDPGAQADLILKLAESTQVEAILLTHGHFDHIGALDEVRSAVSKPIYLHPSDAEQFNITYDIPLQDGMNIPLGANSLKAFHTPGHTPGMTCFDIGEQRIIVGDTIFVGGPGKTWSPESFSLTMETMQQIVFNWPDETEFHPGHGPAGKIGTERPGFNTFLARGWSPSLFGDITWD